jgi:heparan-alpha-glucosaminide N-acetyltransferase
MIPSAPPSSPSPRLASIDAYRGFVMALIVAEALHLRRVAAKVPDSSFWAFLGHHQTHAPWLGCTLHDTIQPSFSFLVGVALPFSLAARRSHGHPPTRTAAHAIGRALILVLLGIGLRSLGAPATYWTFEDTLTQIGLGYGFLFFLGHQPTRTQWVAFAALLLATWAAFAAFPLPPPGFDYAAVGVAPEQGALLPGLAAHWNKNSNLAWAFDTWFLNLFPRSAPFTHHGGGYATLSFVPTLATMILGLIAGTVLRSPREPWEKVRWLAIAGVLGVLAGLAAEASGICPIVKRIWTPAWVLFSGGLCCLYLATFFAVIDLRGYKTWAYPLVVLGTNSILAYCLAKPGTTFIAETLRTHLGSDVFLLFGKPYEPVLSGASAMLIFWAFLAWCYRRKIFVKI